MTRSLLRSTVRGPAALALVLLLAASSLTGPGAGDAGARGSRAGPGPDPLIASVTVFSNGSAKLNPDLGDLLEFNVSLRNGGTANATGLRLNGTYQNATAGPTDIGSIPIAGNLTPLNGSRPIVRASLMWNTTGIGLTAGDPYNITLWITADNDTNVTNNTAIKILVFDPPAHPEPYPATMLAAPDNVTAGDSVLLTATFRNRGDLDSVPEAVHLEVGNATVASGVAPALGAGDFDEWMFGATWQTGGTTPGNHSACAVLNRTGESACTNVTVRPVPPIPRPDLVVTSVVASPAVADVGVRVNLTVNVTNLGTAAANATGLSVFDGAVLVGKATIPPLPAGQGSDHEVVWDTAGARVGNHSVRAVADPLDDVAEENETNNAGNTTVELRSSPDLVLVAVRFLRSSGASTITNATVGDALRVEALVQNAGLVTSPNRTLINLRLDNVSPLASRTLLPLAPASGNVSVRIDWDTAGLAAGDHVVCAEADPGRLVPELDETNNAACGTIHLLAPAVLPNLVLVTFSALPATVAKGDPVTLAAQIEGRNLAGTTNSTVRFTVTPALTNATQKVGDVPATVTPAAPLASVSTTWLDTAIRTAGDYTVCAAADALNAIVESDESDNRGCGTVRLVEAPDTSPDLAILSFNVSKKGIPLSRSTANVTAGTVLELRAKILNRAGADARNVVVRFTDGSDRIGTEKVIPFLAGHADTTVTVNWTPEEGIYRPEAQVLQASSIHAASALPFEVGVGPKPPPTTVPAGAIYIVGGLVAIALVVFLLVRPRGGDRYKDYLGPGAGGAADAEEGDEGDAEDEEAGDETEDEAEEGDKAPKDDEDDGKPAGEEE